MAVRERPIIFGIAAGMAAPRFNALVNRRWAAAG